jgi:rsbT co-antagonist protein RsbR
MNMTNQNLTPVDDSMNAEPLIELYEISSDDLDHIRALGEQLIPQMAGHVVSFYEWLETQPEFDQYFSDRDKLPRVQKMQEDYWTDFFQGHVDDHYVAKRRKIGMTHARIGLSLSVYFVSMDKFLTIFINALDSKQSSDSKQGASLHSMMKLMHLDISIVVDTFNRLTNKMLADQSRALMEMSTPVTAIWDDVLMLPIVGIIDSKRAQDIMNEMLTRIAETHSRVIILDISGVGVVDTAVANHLIKITKATKLMGCECLISGISPAIAQTIVELGIDVGSVKTTTTLKDALVIAFHLTNVEIKEIG